MTKKSKVTNWVNENYAGFEFWYDGSNGRYATYWNFINKETKSYIHISNKAKTNSYEVKVYENAVEYVTRDCMVNAESQTFEKRSFWEKKWGLVKPVSEMVIEL